MSGRYGNVAKATVGAIQRQLLVLEQQGGENFFGEPALEIADLMRTTTDGRGMRQHARRRPADAVAAALRDVPALAAVGAVRGTAGGRRPGEATARLLLRRGASPFRRGAKGAGGEGRAGGEARPLQGRRRIFRHAEPARYAGQRAGAARQPRAACAPRLYAARAEGGARPRRKHFAQIPNSTSKRRSRSSASARRWSRCSRDGGVPSNGAAHAGAAAVVAARPDPRRRSAPRSSTPVRSARQVRYAGRPGIRIRDSRARERSGITPRRRTLPRSSATRHTRDRKEPASPASRLAGPRRNIPRQFAAANR